MPDPPTATRAGTLYVVATPIGNLEDITLRALKILKDVNLVAAEDTRRTANLLRHYDIQTPVLSVREHNEHHRAAAIVGRLAAGETVALVTDAGTPAISDPGGCLVSAVREAGFRVEPIPGASAVLAALSAAGISSDSGFVFVGFPPHRLNDRKKWVAEIVQESQRRAVVLFDAPHRVQSTLHELALLVEYPILICRELTKLHEEILSGKPADLADKFATARGEFTVVIPRIPTSSEAGAVVTDSEIARQFGQMTTEERFGTKRQAARILAERLGLPVRAVYESLERSKLVE